MPNDKMKLSFILCYKKFTCYKCFKEFKRNFGMSIIHVDLERHLKNTHGDAKECLLCHKKLKCGNRNDMRIRHFQIGCVPFKLIHKFYKADKRLVKAKQFADTYFK